MSTPNSFSSGTTISSSAMNANFTDIASEITNSLPRDGQAAMTGQLKAASGTASAPGVTFGADPDTGFYRKSGNEIGISAGGTEVGAFTSKGLTGLAGIPTGVPMPYFGTTAPSGWVRANGRTIGNASSSATERANADTEDLFTLLWNSFSDSVCAVSSGRGASAAADYAANKTITLPDLRGRALFGLDDMGNTAAGRLGAVITSSTTNGASGGSETVTLTEAQLPSHTHGPGTLAGTTGNPTTNPSIGTVRVNPTALATPGSGRNTDYDSANPTLPNHVHDFTVTTGVTASTGSGSAHSNMPPAFLTTFIIKL